MTRTYLQDPSTAKAAVEFIEDGKDLPIISPVNHKPKSLIDYEPSLQDALALIESRKQIFKALLTDDDIQIIQGTQFKKKSYWRKLAELYKVSLEQIKEWREIIDGEFVYFFVIRAIAPWGAYVDGTGTCSNREKNKQKSIHDTRATAETRAKNRAISDLLSFGEVSAEEINDITGNTYQSKKKALTKPISKEDHPNKNVALLINDMINKTYADYINKADFEVELNELKDGKWKDMSYVDLTKLAADVECRCKDKKEQQREPMSRFEKAKQAVDNIL